MEITKYKPSKVILDLLCCKGHEDEYGIYAHVPDLGICRVVTVDRGVIEYDTNINRYFDLLECGVCNFGERFLRKVCLYPSQIRRKVDDKFLAIGSHVRAKYDGMLYDAKITNLRIGYPTVRLYIDDCAWCHGQRDFESSPYDIEIV